MRVIAKHPLQTISRKHEHSAKHILLYVLRITVIL